MDRRAFTKEFKEEAVRLSLNNASYTWSCDGGCGSFNRTDSPVVIWTAPALAGGPYTLRVAVSDGINP